MAKTEDIRSRKSEKEEIKKLLKEVTSKENELWYLLSVEWWDSWKAYVSYDEDEQQEGEEEEALRVSPGPIDNTPLLKEDQRTLKGSLIEAIHYTLVPAEVWQRLKEWYNMVQEEPIARKMTAVGIMRNLQVEIYPLELSIVKEESSFEYQLTISKEAKIRDLKLEICSRLWLPPHSTNLYLELGRTDFRLLTNDPNSNHNDDKNNSNNNGDKKAQNKEDMSLEDSRIMNGHRIFVEGVRSDGSYAGPPKSSQPYSPLFFNTFKFRGFSAFDKPSTKYRAVEEIEDSTTPPEQIGVVGLVNMGNTCFMNSALQCLSNTPSLTEYFLSDLYLQDINRDNPLGMEGKLADQFAPLIKKMWNGEHSYTVPKDFKWIISKFAPQFSGYRQHDAHELLAFVLDGLHEDLNRCIDKPYVEKLEYTGVESDGELASETWARHLLRNQSVIVDLFQGQLKSKLVCPECSKVSIAFDPFMYLSCPLPVTDRRSFRFSLFRKDGSMPRTYGLVVSKYSDIGTVKKHIAEVTGVPFGSLLLAEAHSSRIVSYFKFDSKSIHSIQSSDDIVAYEVLDPKKWELIVQEDCLSNGKSKSKSKEKKNKEKVKSKDSKEKDSKGKEKTKENSKEGEKIKSKDSKEKEGKGKDKGKEGKENKENKEEKGETERNDSKEKDDEGVERGSQIGKRLAGTDHVLCQFITRLAVKKRSNMKTSFIHIGFPFLLSFSKNISYSSLVKEVWKRLQIFTSPSDEKNELFDEKYVEEVSPKSKSEEKYPFSLRYCSQNGFSCFHCNSNSPCKGCALEDIKISSLVTGKVIAIDLHERFIFKKYEEDDSVNLTKEEEEKPIDLEECIALFLQEEILSPEEAWYCPQCREFREATKKFDVWRFPDHLIIHLKRFHQLPNSQIRQKIDRMVTYPIENLNLTSLEMCPPNTSRSPPIFDLVAVSNHHGGMGGGHYTAYAKNKIDGRWYKFNDKTCTEVPEYEVENKDAYILFYVKRSLLASTPVALPDLNEFLSFDHSNQNGASHIEVQVTEVDSSQSLDLSNSFDTSVTTETSLLPTDSEKSTERKKRKKKEKQRLKEKKSSSEES